MARKEKIRHKYISGTAKVRCFGDKIREAMFRWCEYLDKWDKRFQEGRREDVYKKKKKIKIPHMALQCPKQNLLQWNFLQWNFFHQANSKALITYALCCFTAKVIRVQDKPLLFYTSCLAKLKKKKKNVIIVIIVIVCNNCFYFS